MERGGFLFLFVYFTLQNHPLVYLLCTVRGVCRSTEPGLGSLSMHMYACAFLIPRRVLGWGRLRILFLGRRRAGTWSILEH